LAGLEHDAFKKILPPRVAKCKPFAMILTIFLELYFYSIV
jgi:hypothetical protein